MTTSPNPAEGETIHHRLAVLLGWRYKPDEYPGNWWLHPNGCSLFLELPPLSELVREGERKLDLRNRGNTRARVRWVNRLREIVGRPLPKNAAGAALVSDVDLILALDEEKAEAMMPLLEELK